MFLWDVHALALRFRAKRVSEWDKFRYYALILILGALFQGSFHPGHYSSPFQEIQETIAVTFLSVLGAWYCYQVNGRGDNEDFMGRILCLGFPIAIRILVISIVGMLCIDALIKSFPSLYLSVEDFSILQSFLILSLTSLSYYWLYKAMAIASGAVPGDRKSSV